MARVEVFTPACPANTLIAAPVERSCNFSPGRVDSVQIVIPHGHRGNTGLQLALAHQQIVPNTPGAWLIDNGASPTYELPEHPDSGAWSVWLYNLDTYAHQWQIRFKITDLRRPVVSDVFRPIPVEHIHKILNAR